MKVAAYTLAMLMLVVSTEIHQLFRLPVLIGHFNHHSQENNSLSFFDFIRMHYTDNNHPQDNDEEEDNQLPFKSQGNISHFDNLINEKDHGLIPFIFFDKKTNISHSEDIPDNRSLSIFHPPRID